MTGGEKGAEVDKGEAPDVMQTLYETQTPRATQTLKKPDVIAALTALAQETRLDVFRALVEGGHGGCVPGALSKSLGIPAATLSFHLKELKNAQLVSSERQGRSLVYRADFETMQNLVAYLGENCCQAQGCGPA